MSGALQDVRLESRYATVKAEITETTESNDESESSKRDDYKKVLVMRTNAQ